MQLFFTAGNTQSPIDSVRCITNIFTGRTGSRIALEAYQRGHHVTLATSHPQLVSELAPGVTLDPERFRVRPYQTYDELHHLMATSLRAGRYDAVIHSAAVSDYTIAGIYSGPLTDLRDVSAPKVKSQHPEIWMKFLPSLKLVDQIREPWGFRGILVKFKLEVGVTEAELLATAERSRQHSLANFMVANTLEDLANIAYIGGDRLPYRVVERAQLAATLLDLVEQSWKKSQPS